MKKILFAVSIIVFGVSLGYSQSNICGISSTANYPTLEISVKKKIESQEVIKVKNDSTRQIQKNKKNEILANYYNKKSYSNNMYIPHPYIVNATKKD